MIAAQADSQLVQIYASLLWAVVITMEFTVSELISDAISRAVSPARAAHQLPDTAQLSGLVALYSTSQRRILVAICQYLPQNYVCPFTSLMTEPLLTTCFAAARLSTSLRTRDNARSHLQRRTCAGHRAGACVGAGERSGLVSAGCDRQACRGRVVGPGVSLPGLFCVSR